MKMKSLAVGLLVMCAVVSGCTRDGLQSAGVPAETAAEGGRASSHTFAFERAGITASSRVERRVACSGGETLHGATSVTLVAVVD